MKQRKLPTGMIAASWFMTLMAGFLACLFVSWMSFAGLDYTYSLWYSLLDIGAHIDKYAPQNDYILGLNHVAQVEHERLFAEIVTAVHQHGQGLATIQFSSSQPTTLLRAPEVVHLQDVANLIDVFRVVGWISIVLFIVGLTVLVLQRTRPNWFHQLWVLLGLIVGLTLLVILLGAKDVFYQLHVWVFPDDHQWFFYYQESLMTTLMKAPDIFAAIAASILVVGLLLFIALVMSVRWLAQVRS